MAITTRSNVFTNKAKGLGFSMPFINSGTTGTAAVASSGFLSLSLGFNTIGSTTPGTLVGLPIPSGLTTTPMLTHLAHGGNSSSVARVVFLAWLYKLGTVDLANAAATPYDGFTHNANWSGKIQRTYDGAASQNILMAPLLYVTTLTATTAPAFILQTTSGPGNGYVNQAAANVIGTKTFTCPAAATVAGSTYWLRLEDGDSAITDMTQISVTTKGTAGAGTIFGAELLFPVSYLGIMGGVFDGMFSSLWTNDLNPGVPSSGTLTINTDCYLGLVSIQSGTAVVNSNSYSAVLNV